VQPTIGKAERERLISIYVAQGLTRDQAETALDCLEAQRDQLVVDEQGRVRRPEPGKSITDDE
jgi:hypothetical protein